MPNVDKNGEVWPDSDDLDLNTSPDLPTGNITEGMSPDSLSPATRAALTHGFQTDTDGDKDKSLDGGELSGNDQPNAIDPRGYPVSGFVRPEAYRKQEFLD